MLDTAEKKRLRNHYNEMTSIAQAFLATLEKHIDSPVTRADLLEEFPDVEWNGNIASTWQLLLKQRQLEDRLVCAGEGSEVFYALLSSPNDMTILTERLNYVVDYYEKASVQEKFIDVWYRRKLALASLSTALGGMALGVYMMRRRKK